MSISGAMYAPKLNHRKSAMSNPRKQRKDQIESERLTVANSFTRYALNPKNAKTINRVLFIGTFLCVLTLVAWLAQFVIASQIGESVSPLAAYGTGFLVLANLIIFTCAHLLFHAIASNHRK